jgi:L-2,4-diaminobutyrate decarboxylase
MFESEFLTSANADRYRDLIAKAATAVVEALPRQPYVGTVPSELTSRFGAMLLPDQGLPPDRVWRKLREIVAHSLNVTHPNTIAHLHCPPLVSSLAAEVVIAALNQSMDSFDQAPAATMLELAVGRWLCQEAGLPASADAVFTAGGSQSNFMGLLLARDACIASRWNWPVAQKGLPSEAPRLRFLCSEVAHFTVEKTASQLGLGSEAVVRIPVDAAFQMIPSALADTLRALQEQNLIPAAVVATAGTTDFGSIDPLPQIAALARESGAWLHVDAAYGSALLLSAQHRELLRGIELADSISVDFHKEFWQPISCAAFLLRDAAHFRHLAVHADYLNPETDEAAGIPNLVTRSVATTRRFDALKLWFSLQLLGREKFAAMIDRTIELAAHAAKQIRANPWLELLHEPRLSSVVFRYVSSNLNTDADTLNARLRQQLFDRGLAVIGHTRARGRQCLKFTCMNPCTTEADVDALLDLIVGEGKRLEAAGA